MTVQVTINSNNPLVAGTYTTVDGPSMLTALAPVLAVFTPIVPNSVDTAVYLLTINGHVAFLTLS